MEVGKLSASAEITGLDKIEKAVNEMKASMDKLVKSMDGMATASKKVATAATEAATAKRKVREEADKAAGSTENLGRRIRELTTGLLGTSVAAVALGTAIGNIATQLISRAVLAIISAFTAVNRLKNELAETAPLMNRVGQEFEFVARVAETSGRSIDTVNKEWIELAKETAMSSRSIEDVRKSFDAWNLALGQSRTRTFSNDLDAMMTAFGRLGNSFGQNTQLGRFLLSVMGTLTAGMNRLADMIGKVTEEEEKNKAAVTRLTERHNDLFFQIERMKEGDFTGIWKNYGQGLMTAEQKVRALAQAQTELDKISRAIDIAAMGGVQVFERRKKLMDESLDAAERELIMANSNVQTQEILTKLFATQLAFKDSGKKISKEELEVFNQIFLATQKSTQEIKNMHQQAQNTVTALSGVPTSFGSLFVQPIQTLSMGMGMFTEELTTFHLPAFQSAYEEMEKSMRQQFKTEAEIFAMKRNLHKQEQDQILQTASLAANAITALFPKSKAAAIAAAIINTAVAVTKALSGAAPPLNFINAALVAAAGVGQIMAIRNTSPTGGGSVPSVGSAPSQTPPAEQGPGGRTVTIRMEGGQLFSSEQLAEFIGRINNEVQNGATLIATETT